MDEIDILKKVTEWGTVNAVSKQYNEWYVPQQSLPPWAPSLVKHFKYYICTLPYLGGNRFVFGRGT